MVFNFPQCATTVNMLIYSLLFWAPVDYCPDTITAAMDCSLLLSDYYYWKLLSVIWYNFDQITGISMSPNELQNTNSQRLVRKHNALY